VQGVGFRVKDFGFGDRAARFGIHEQSVRFGVHRVEARARQKLTHLYHGPRKSTGGRILIELMTSDRYLQAT